MNINIISVGKVREKYLKSGIDEFLKRIQPYSSLKITEINAELLKDESLIQKAIEIEGDKILSKIPDTSYVIVMEVLGKQLSSEDFAKEITKINSKGINQLVFVIGGAYGLSEKVKRRADLLLSFSKMTLPHQIMRLFLLEQIYRAFRIIQNEPYHK